jgi:hypothetical protein
MVELGDPTATAFAAVGIPLVQHILTLDACRHSHFTQENTRRDLRKAFTSFAAFGSYCRHNPRINSSTASTTTTTTTTTTTSAVSTGRWGCGIFGGTPSHKFTQQLLAARLAGVSLRFSTFGTPDGCNSVLEMLEKKKSTVAEVWSCIQQSRDRASFESGMGIPSTRHPGDAQKQKAFEQYSKEKMKSLLLKCAVGLLMLVIAAVWPHLQPAVAAGRQK